MQSSLDGSIGSTSVWRAVRWNGPQFEPRLGLAFSNFEQENLHHSLVQSKTNWTVIKKYFCGCQASHCDPVIRGNDKCGWRPWQALG